MKPIVSPDRLGWTYELLVRLEAVFKASTRGPLGKRLKQLAGWIGTPHRPLSKPNHEIPPALWHAYSIAMARYLPAPLEVPVTVYAADHDGRGWRLGSEVEVIEVPGGHRDCLAVGAERLVDLLWGDEPHAMMPVIAAVQGTAAGFGLDLAVACDVRLAGASATFTSAFSRMGLVPDGGSTFTLPRLVGVGPAMLRWRSSR